MNADTLNAGPREAASYQPRPGSLPQRLISYFRRLPDEELSIYDIAQKFDTPHDTVHQLLKVPAELCILQRDGKIYTAGPQIGQPEAGTKAHTQPGPGVGTEAPAPAQAATPQKRASGYASPRYHIDFSALQVESNVPFTGQSTKGGDKYGPLFAKLAKPNDSVRLPLAMKAAISAAIVKRNKTQQGRFASGKVSDTEVRVWRLE